MGAVTAFRAYDRPLEAVSAFKYLGRLLTAIENYWLAVLSNLWKTRKSWSQLDHISCPDIMDTRKPGRFYVAIVQAILLFGLERWVVMPRIKRLLGGFHHRVERRIS